MKTNYLAFASGLTIVLSLSIMVNLLFYVSQNPYRRNDTQAGNMTSKHILFVQSKV